MGPPKTKSEISREPIMYNLLFMQDLRSPESPMQNGVCEYIYRYIYYHQIPYDLKLTLFIQAYIMT